MFIKYYKHSQWLTIISVALFLCIHPPSFNVAMLQAPWSSSLHVLLRSLVVANYIDLPTLFTYSLAATLSWFPHARLAALFPSLCWLLSCPTTSAECLMTLSPKPLFPHYLQSLWGHLLQSHANTQTIFWPWHLPKIFSSYSKCPQLEVSEAFQA